MEFKGTKVQWIVSPNAGGGFIADISDNFAIAKAFDNTFIQKGEMEANAQLIACAPEMFEALKEIIAFAEFHGYTSSTEINNAISILKKATTI